MLPLAVLKISLHHFGVRMHRDIWIYNTSGFSKRAAVSRFISNYRGNKEKWNPGRLPRYLINVIFGSLKCLVKKYLKDTLMLRNKNIHLLNRTENDTAADFWSSQNLPQLCFILKSLKICRKIVICCYLLHHSDGATPVTRLNAWLNV